MATCALAALAVVPTTSRPAYAACDQTGSTVDCTGITTNYNAGSQDGLTFTVQPGATLQGTGGTSAFKLTSGVSGNALINNGTIDGVYDFDVHIEVEMTNYKNLLVPKVMRYNGNWDVIFKKRENGIFTATLFDFTD